MPVETRRDATMTWRDARALARGIAVALDVEDVGLDRVPGRVLAAEVRSQTLLPGYDAAAMDGYAVAGEGPWHVVGRVMAGEGAPAHLADGTAVEIATGAWVPPNAGVLPYEDCHYDGVLVSGERLAKSHVRRAGEDLRPGDLLGRPGQEVTAALLGLVAQGGHDRLSVRRRARVRVVVTGDEVVRHGLPAPGQVRDALGPLAASFVTGCGAETAELIQVPDSLDRLASAVRTADADVVVVTGSSSVGRADYLRAVLREMGATARVDGVACRPGHPQVLAELPAGRWVIGVPGNPFAGLVACLTLLEPLLDGLHGRVRRAPLTLPLVGSPAPPGQLTRLIPVRLGAGYASLIADARPARLRAAADADAVAVVEPGWCPDHLVEVLALR